MTFSERTVWIFLALAVITVAVFAPVWQHSFLDYDDRQYVSENPHVIGGLSWDGVVWAFTSGYQANWHPVTWISHMLDVQVFGLHPGLHHLSNLLFHIANALLLFTLLLRMTGSVWRSAFVAGLFAIHPLHVESVAWVAERKDVLSTMFWLLTTWAYVTFVRDRTPRRYAVVLVLFALGLMSKPMLVTLPFVLLLLDVWPLKRFSPEPVAVAQPKRKRHAAAADTPMGTQLPYLVWEKLPLFAMAAVSSILTFLVQQQGGAVKSLDRIPWNVRASNAMLTYVEYIRDMVWPSSLAVHYPLMLPFSPWSVAFAFLLVSVVSVVLLFARRVPGYLITGWFWYVGTLVPVIGFIQVGLQSRADRYTYVPFIGLFIIVAWGIPDLAQRWPTPSKAVPAFAAAAILACAITARHQVGFWRDSVTLWTRAVEVTPSNAVAHNNLGFALGAQGNLDAAIAELTTAVRDMPDYVQARNNLGFALMAKGRIAEAIAQFSAVVRLDPAHANARYGLGLALEKQGRFEDAMRQFAEAVRIDPADTDARQKLAALSRAGAQNRGPQE